MQKILIADDEAKIRRIIRDFLTAKGFETVEAEDGAQALRVFAENSDIALAVLDIMMPKMDGYTLVGARPKDPQNLRYPGHFPDCARRRVRRARMF